MRSKPGRPPLGTLRIYWYGLIRLPANFELGTDQTIKLQLVKNRLLISFAVGEVGLKPHIRTGSALVDARRLFKQMGVDPLTVAGEYRPRREKGVLSVSLKESTNGKRKLHGD